MRKPVAVVQFSKWPGLTPPVIHLVVQLMLTLRLPPALDKSLGRSARAAKQTKSAFVRDAVLARIAEAEDYRIAVKRLARVKAGKEKTVSFDDLKRTLGL